MGDGVGIVDDSASADRSGTYSPRYQHPRLEAHRPGCPHVVHPHGKMLAGSSARRYSFRTFLEGQSGTNSVTCFAQRFIVLCSKSICITKAANHDNSASDVYEARYQPNVTQRSKGVDRRVTKSSSRMLRGVFSKSSSDDTRATKGDGAVSGEANFIESKKRVAKLCRHDICISDSLNLVVQCNPMTWR